MYASRVFIDLQTDGGVTFEFVAAKWSKAIQLSSRFRHGYGFNEQTEVELLFSYARMRNSLGNKTSTTTRTERRPRLSVAAMFPIVSASAVLFSLPAIAIV